MGDWTVFAVVYLLIALGVALLVQYEPRHQTRRDARIGALLALGCGLLWPPVLVLTAVAWVHWKVTSWPSGWVRLDDRCFKRLQQIYDDRLRWRTVIAGKNWGIWLIRRDPAPPADEDDDDEPAAE